MSELCLLCDVIAIVASYIYNGHKIPCSLVLAQTREGQEDAFREALASSEWVEQLPCRAPKKTPICRLVCTGLGDGLTDTGERLHNLEDGGGASGGVICRRYCGSRFILIRPVHMVATA
jgi:hypothetical protein